jgi:hypothetical protein
MIVMAAVLVTAAPAGAEQSAGPDAAPTGSKAPRPDPAPANSTPRPAIVVPPARGSAAPTAGSAAPAAAAPARPASKPVHHAATHRKTPVRHRQPAHAAKRRAHVTVPPLPRLSLAQLSAPPTTGDADRARTLAAGALSLLIFALASATLLAFTARVERRRVLR